MRYVRSYTVYTLLQGGVYYSMRCLYYSMRYLTGKRRGQSAKAKSTTVGASTSIIGQHLNKVRERIAYIRVTILPEYCPSRISLARSPADSNPLYNCVVSLTLWHDRRTTGPKSERWRGYQQPECECPLTLNMLCIHNHFPRSYGGRRGPRRHDNHVR
jgi:hypothetical protein